MGTVHTDGTQEEMLGDGWNGGHDGEKRIIIGVATTQKTRSKSDATHTTELVANPPSNKTESPSEQF